MASTTFVVIGTGSIGARHLRVLQGLPDVRVIACPLRAARGDELAAQGFEVAGSLAEAAGRGATMCVVATDTARHVADTAAALASGMHVLVEKPLSATGLSLAGLARVIEASGRTVAVAFNLRFEPSLRAFRDHLGAIGQVDAVRIECQSYLPGWRPGTDHRRGYSARAEEGGVLRDLSHEIDYGCWLLGRPAGVFARLGTTRRLEIASEEHADLLWSVNGGPTVSVRLDYLARPTRRRMIATGALGTLTWDGVASRVTLEPADGPTTVVERGGKRDATMLLQLEAFLARVQGGSAPGHRDLATFDEGRFVVALSDAARRSAVSGREEAIVEPALPGGPAPIDEDVLAGHPGRGVARE